MVWETSRSLVRVLPLINGFKGKLSLTAFMNTFIDNKLSTTLKLHAVAYLRKSTREMQENSILNQRKAIDAFAEHHNIHILKYFIDDGISGLTMSKRDAFKELINEYVIGGKLSFSIILVLDVTRWGRFQDIDESAHLEFICRKHGKEIIYVTEEFKNDNSIMDSLIKALKRAMAAEYSKNLSDKVLAGSLTIARQGFRVGAPAPYGFERMRLDQQRNPVGILHDGERKAIANERVTLVPGNAEEVETIKHIFGLFTRRGLREGNIAIELNERKIPSPGGGEWTENTIRVMLRDETYTGTLRYNRTSSRLHGPTRKNPRDRWVLVPQAFEAIVSPDTFLEAQQIFQKRHPVWSDQDILLRLQELFQTHGKLTGLIIESTPQMPSTNILKKRFGSLFNAYKLVGYVPPYDIRFFELKELVKSIEERLWQEVFAALVEMGLTVVDHGTHLCLNDQLNIQLMASSIRNNNGKKRWVYRFDRQVDIDLTLAVRLADDAGNILDFYCFPSIAMETDKLFVSWSNGIYLDAYRFDKIIDVYDLFGDSGHINKEKTCDEIGT